MHNIIHKLTMTNRLNPYFCKQPRTIHIFNNVSPTQSLPLTNRTPSPPSTSSSKIRLHRIISPRPPSQHSHHSDYSRLSNSISQSSSTALSVEKYVDIKGWDREIERLKEELVKALKRIKQLEEKEIEGIVIKNENVNLRSELYCLKTRACEQMKDDNFLQTLQHQALKFQEENLYLKQQLKQIQSNSNQLLIEIQRLNKLVMIQNRHFIQTSERCKTLESLCLSLQQTISQLMQSQKSQRQSHKLVSIQNFQSMPSSENMHHKDAKHLTKSLNINRKAYTDAMYQ